VTPARRSSPLVDALQRPLPSPDVCPCAHFVGNRRRAAIARCLAIGVGVPTQLVLAWSGFLFLLFLVLRLDKVCVSGSGGGAVPCTYGIAV
jgi:hypothetical protein